MTTELLKQALDALERFAYHGRAMGWEKVALDIRAHLAAPALEPVAYRHLHDDGYEYYDAPTGSDCAECEPLYAAPAPAVPPEVTREWVRDLVKGCGLDWHRGFAPLFDGDDTNRYEVLVRAALAAAPSSPPPVALSARELELLEGMIKVQLHHAAQCDGIANRVMAAKQKGWDMERVALLRKLGGIKQGGQA